MNKTDRSAMIRLASSLPAGSEERRHILSALSEREASVEKVAISEDTENFIEWVLATQSKMNPNAVVNFIEKKTGLEPKQPAAKKPARRGPLQLGETVLVNERKNTNPLNVDACKAYHNRVGMVEKIGDEGLTIAFYKGDNEHPSTELSGDKQYFDGLGSGKTTGLYRWTPKPAYAESGDGSRRMFEVVYLRAGQSVDQRSMEQIEQYVDRGTQKGENRNRAYYSGRIINLAISKKGQPYFSMAVQQRDRPVHMNPVEGKVLYIGPIGGRPSGWERDAIEMGLAAK